MPRLDDPAEFAIIREIYFDDKRFRLKGEDVDRQEKRNKKQTNQAR